MLWLQAVQAVLAGRFVSGWPKSGYYILINYKGNEAAASETLELLCRKQAVVVNYCSLMWQIKKKYKMHLGGWMESNADKIIEVLVNNAGIKDDVLMMWMKDEQWDNVLQTSLGGFFYVTRLVVNSMLKEIWKDHQYCFAFRIKRIGRANQLFGS